MGRSFSMSPRISSNALLWAFVSANGRRESMAFSTSRFLLIGGAPPASRHSLRRENTYSCIINSSSKASLRLAESLLSQSCG